MLVLDKDFIKNNGMMLEDKGHGVYFIRNFLDENEYTAFMDIVQNINEQDWSKAYWDNLYRKAEFMYGTTDILDLIASKKISDPSEFFGNYELYHNKTFYFGPEAINNDLVRKLHNKWENIFMTDDDDVKSRYDWDAPLFIERRYPGSSTPIHADVGSGELLTYATILYINDDFEGGEIFFPEVNISLKPEKGSLCIFTGKSGILHGVAEVTSGTRYSIPIFVWDMTADQSYRKIHK